MKHPEPPSSSALLRGYVLVASLLAAAGSAGCGAGSYVWVDQLGADSAQDTSEDAYLIASGDLLNIRIYDQESISTRCRVSPDGKIALPLVGEIEVRGQSPSALARQI